MAKAIAIAVVRENPFTPALESAKNLAMLLADFMYGTPQRTKMTCRIALAITVLGVALSFAQMPVVCDHDTLAATL